MMVTFVSQCEKKALLRTRRVLDAFANRIGDNTWQTIITQEGLLAVKKLLRKTASKNTAVSCHWIRSRSRTELVWVVGQRDKFNQYGIVPVNTTEKEVPMDIATGKPLKGVLYANTQLQSLDQHLFAVGMVARKLLQHFYGENIEPTCLNAVYIAGCLHDIGKVDPEFQKWVKDPKNKSYVPDDGQHIDKGEKTKFSFENHPRHNEVSTLLYYLLDDRDLKSLNKGLKASVKHAVYWHHAKPFRKEAKGGFNQYGDIYNKLKRNIVGDIWEEVVNKASALLGRVCEIEKTYYGSVESSLSKCYRDNIEKGEFDFNDIERLSLPAYKCYDTEGTELREFCDAAKNNARNNELRCCLITADRWVSSLSAKELGRAVKHTLLDDFVKKQCELYELLPESNLISEITVCLKSFPDSERTKKQAMLATSLVKDGQYVKVLAGAAGCGKTKIALEWAARSGVQKLLWICPRVQICQGLFAELSADGQPYLPHTNVEIHTGEYKCLNDFGRTVDEDEYFTGDIVITTIDQILGAVVSHSKADRLLNYLSAHVVFDEFHEYITMPAFNLLFAELLSSRKGLVGGAKALLVSATPHYTFLNKILDISEHDIQEMPSFNPSKYRFEFKVYDEKVCDETNPLYQTYAGSTFIISNTATTAQKSFLMNQGENGILLHSKFKKSDKRFLFEEVFNSFRRDGTLKFDVLRSGPIVQASLNISCDHMVSEITSAENCLQRLGRLDRFGNNTETINVLDLLIPDTLHAGKGTGSLARFLLSNNLLESVKVWYAYLGEATNYGEKALTLTEIYQIYKSFYASEHLSDCLNADLVVAMKKSACSIASKISEPQVRVRPKNAMSKRAKISRNSLRGESRFVQMAICDLSDYLKPGFIDKYAYETPSSESEQIDSLTESLDIVVNTGLLDYLSQKHGRIDESHPVKGVPANKSNIRKKLLESFARDPEYPLFLSYTGSEMDQKLGISTPHDEAMYYVITDRQPVGTLSIKHFIQQEK